MIFFVIRRLRYVLLIVSYSDHLLAAEHRLGRGSDMAAAEGKDGEGGAPVVPPTIAVAAVIGCGLLGGRICLELASVGVSVRVYDRGMGPKDVANKMREFERE